MMDMSKMMRKSKVAEKEMKMMNDRMMKTQKKISKR